MIDSLRTHCFEVVATLLVRLGEIAAWVRNDPLRPDWVQVNREGIE